MIDPVQIGKGKRVSGVFLVLMGGGLWLESNAWLLGTMLLASGVGSLMWGFWEFNDTNPALRTEASVEQKE